MKREILCLGFAVSALALMVSTGSPAFAQEEGAAPAPAVEEAPQVEPPAVPQAEPAAEPPKEEAPFTAEQKAAVRQAAEKLVKEEIEVVGSFEVDHPDTGDALSLTLDRVQDEVTKVSEDVFKLLGDFKDEAGSSYVVELQLEKYGENEYEIVDAIVVSGAPKPSAAAEEVV